MSYTPLKQPSLFPIALFLVFVVLFSPVFADTIGYDQVGGSSSSSNAVICTKQTATASGSITKLTVYYEYFGVNFTFRTAVYSDSSGIPNSKLAESSGATTVTATGWHDSNISLSVTNGTVYHLCAWQNSSNGSYHYDTTGASADQTHYDAAETFPTWPASFSNSGGLTWRVSLYATYTPASSDTTPPVRSAGSPTGTLASGTTSATLSLTTNENATCKYSTTSGVSYASMSNIFSTTGGASHSTSVPGLSNGQTYTYYVKCQDTAGNANTDDYSISFSIASVSDTSAPTISSVAAGSLTSSGATITWTTNEASDTQVEYGTTTAYGSSTTLNTSLVTSHSQTLSGLFASTLYHYRVKSKDAAGNLATSGDSIFTTTTPTAQTITAASCSQADIATAHAAASNGDTVVVPAGTCDWSEHLQITKGITLQGNGIGSTVIRDAEASNNRILSFALVPGFTSRLTGFEFRDLSNNGNNSNGVTQCLNNTGNSGRIRVDNNYFNNLHGVSFFIYGCYGVVDHNTVNVDISAGPRIAFYTHRYLTDLTLPDQAWADPPNLGNESFVFFEDNTVTYSGGFYTFNDAFGGARYVVRRNTLTNVWIEAHGTESGGRPRGSRAVEVYENTFACTVSCTTLVNYRSGTGVVYNNTVTGFTNPAIYLRAQRLDSWHGVWSAADGTSNWDVNDAANPLETNTATGGSSSTMTRSSASWVTNQWVGYSLLKTNCTASASNACAGYITSNTATTITFSCCGGFNTPPTFSNGDTYQINKVTEVLDQPGRGQGTNLNGASPPSWSSNNQVDEPLYEWGNTQSATNIGFISSYPLQIRATEHYVSDTIKPGYTAYVYPHPLASVVDLTPPSAPTGVSVQ